MKYPLNRIAHGTPPAFDPSLALLHILLHFEIQRTASLQPYLNRDLTQGAWTIIRLFPF